MATGPVADRGLDIVLPERIGRLGELANNLWWSWHAEARDVFRTLDYLVWKATVHNPVKQLRQVDPLKLAAAASDQEFLGLYDKAMSMFDRDMHTRSTWFEENFDGSLPGPVCFFSMEFAIHNSLPIYAGGLGILAGDLCKEASDLGLPVVGIGFMYPQGYFHQHVSAEGWQEEVYSQLDFTDAPIDPVILPDGNRTLATVELDGVPVHIGAWKIRVGRTDVYLLDTNLEANSPRDRVLTGRLYIADPDLRIRQEVVLGIGGVRVLNTLGIQPAGWHANEGHTAFMMLERIRQAIQKGASLEQALAEVRSSTVFTTHTPVPAGHDVFPDRLLNKYLDGYWNSLGTNRESLLRLGRDGVQTDSFNMTVLALRLADRRNAVSELHGMVARRMWHVLWPELPEDKVPITYITNGIHIPSWVAPEICRLFDEYLGPGWIEKTDDPSVWERVYNIPDSEVWAAHQLLKRKLNAAIGDWARDDWADNRIYAEQVLAMGAMLDADVLTVGFVRRFAEYKRPFLIFHDVERLKKLVADPLRPVQIIFSGKSHPADFPSKFLLRQVYLMAKEPAFKGRIAFVEDYNMHKARFLVHGMDVWLNVPRRLMEASGTSGMKAAVNGVPHLSVRDGWWYEGYNGRNGWAIGDSPAGKGPLDEDSADAAALYDILEKLVVPLYYERGHDDVPHGWAQIMKESMRSVGPRFSARRMLKQYIEFYLKESRLKGLSY